MRRPHAINGLIAVLGAVSVLAWTVNTPTGPPPSLAGILLLVVAAVVVDWWPLTMEHRGETLHMTLSGIVVVLGVVFISPVATLVARLVGSLCSLVFRWRMPGPKLIFNLVVQSLEVWIVAAVLSALVPRVTAMDPRVWVAIPSALIASDVTSFALVMLAMRVVAGRLRWNVVAHMGVGVVYSTAISATFAVVGVILIDVDPRAALGLAAIFALLVQTNRARHGVTERYRNLSSLYGFMDAVTSTETDDVIRNLLHEAVRVTGAEHATLLFSAPDRCTSITVDDGDELVVREANATSLAALAATAHLGVLIPVGGERPVPTLTGAPADQAMIVSFGQDDMRGVLLLEGRRGNMPDFDATDVQLAKGMARHAGTALVTSQLVEKLRESTDTMERLALYDRDTELPNRTGLLRMPLDADGTAVALVEIGDLHTFEGTFGHHSAAHVVSAIATRLRDMEDGGFAAVARVADNRFAVVLRDAEDPVAVQRRIRRMRSMLQAPIRETGINLEVQVLIGVATSAATGGSLDHMLRAAAGALNQVTSQEGGDTVWFDPSMDTRATARIRLASDLRDAIDGGELTLAYQPKVDLPTGRIVGVEALCRWTRQDGQSVNPGEFIPIAEQTGLIRPLTEWVVTEAVSQAARWHEQGLDLSMAINVSPDALRDPAIVRGLIDRCLATGLPPDMITVEITESLMMGDLERGSGLLWVIDDAGMHISVDDFGTGYSSLAQLKDLPVDEVKIDRSFVMEIERSPQDQAITAAIVAMARRLDLTVVAEGVETPAALAFLRDVGCDMAQGYLLGRPMSARDITARASGAATGVERVLPFRRTQPGA